MTALDWFGAGCGVFLCAFAYDFANAKYLVAVDLRARWRAGAWSVATYAIGLVSLAAVFRGSLWLAFPEAAGLFAGTVAGMPLPASRTTRL